MKLHALWSRLLTPARRSLLWPPELGAEPIQAWLDVAGVPWRSSRAELTDRYGIRSDNAYHWEIVSLDVKPAPLPGMLWPFGFQAFPQFSPDMPPGRLSTHVYVSRNPETNIRAAASSIGAALGEVAVVDRYNTRSAEWRRGAASVSLRVWPPAMQSGTRLNIPAHRRDPRLETACSVEVLTGWRPPLSLQDRSWLDGFEPMGETRNWTPARPRAALGDTAFTEAQLEWMREPPLEFARFRGYYGLSACGEALIFCEDALCIVPLVDVESFEVTRLLPAKGGGGSYMSARCRTGYTIQPFKSLQVAQGASADDLNEPARRLAQATGKPFKLESYQHDV